jgi:hypothetical protein
MRLLYSHFYGGNMEILWPLRTWIRHIIERQKTPEFTVEKALAKDAAEREVALSLRRPLAEEHWARVEEGLFAVRSRMMAKVPCNLTIVEIWEYNIDLDAGAYPLIANFPLAMSDRDEHHDFFQFIRTLAR